MLILQQMVFRILKFQPFSLLLAGGLFLLTGCGDSTSEVATKADEEQAAVAATSMVDKVPVQQETTAGEQIRQLFAALQSANLDENIDEFMRYYADSFPAREQKRQSTLQNWQKYDFGSLDFFIFDLKIEEEVAEAVVGWEIALLEVGGAVPRLMEMTHQVKLIKAAQGWQILSLQ